MSAKPIEALALVAMTAAQAPPWLDAYDWWLFQGVFMGAALAAIIGEASIGKRIWRLIASVLIAYICAEFIAHLCGQETRAGVRFVGGVTAFVGWWAAKGIEATVPSAFKKAAKAGTDALVNRAAALGLGAGTTDRASDLYDRDAVGDQGDKAANKQGGGGDAR